MAGAIIENMSTKKLLFLGFFVFLLQILSIVIGALIAPSPTSAIRYSATKCINRHRSRRWLTPWGQSRCQQVKTFDEPLAKTLDANDIVFAVHMPLPDREMSPWFQYVLAVLQFDIAFKMINQIEDDNVIVTIDAGIAYRDNVMHKWTTMFHSVEQRPLRCVLGVPKTYENEGRFYHCDPVPLMELGTVAHKYFLMNLRLPVNDTVNVGIGEIKDVHVVSIHQNGGFTKVWICMKSVCAPWILAATAWYWHRIGLMARPPVLLEKVILALGVSLSVLNVPVELLSLLHCDWPWLLLLEDVQHGLFSSALFCFWLVFCGEHLTDQSQRNRLSSYWWQVGLVLVGSSVLLLFDLCERGVHLTNPFYNVWASDTGTKLSMTFITVAAVSLGLYFLSLCHMVRSVFINIGGKLQLLPALPEARRLRYKGIVFRFKFLMLVTLACAAMTVIFFILNQWCSGPWQWGGSTLQLHSSFLTGILGMWNLYVFTIVFLYAPSHRHIKQPPRGQLTGEMAKPQRLQQQTQLVARGEQGPTETYRMAGKVSED